MNEDNLEEIEELFEKREDERYAGGYAYFCKKCNQECNVAEIRLLCEHGKKVITPKYIICRYGCGCSWHLRIGKKKSIH